jgi:Tfp pilus assembly protein PilN
MMRRVDLLPGSYVERRRQQRQTGFVILAILVAVLLVIGYWFYLGTQISDAESELAEVEQTNASIQAEIDKLQRFADLDESIKTKQAALTTVMAGDVDWPAVLTEIALVIPGEVWLTEMTGSALVVEGATPAGTETAPIRPTTNQSFGRITFSGRSITMPGIAKWMIRLGTVKKFATVWLNDATEVDEEFAGGIFPIDFENTIEFSTRAAARGRFEEGT